MMLRPLFRFAVAWVALSAPAWAVVERTVEKTFALDASATPTLTVDAFTGNVVVRTDDAAPGATQIQVRVIQRMEVDKEEDADRILDRLDLTLDQAGQGVRISAQFRVDATWTWKNWPPVFLTFEIKVPPACHVNFSTRGSAITIAKLTGDVEVRNDSGAIFIAETTGNIIARSERGDISVTACSGTLTASTVSGSILAGRVGGRANISSNGGNIEVQTARAGVDIKGNGSDITVGFDYPIMQAASVKTSGADVTIKLDPRSACTLIARASTFGSVRVRDLKLVADSGGVGKSRLTTRLGGGGPRLEIEASGGQVYLQGINREPLP